MKATSRRGVKWAAIAIAAVVIVGATAGGFWIWHEQPTFCADLCHIMQPYEDSWTSSNYEAHIHAEEEIECLDCHEPTIKEQIDEVTAYVTGDYKVPLRERKLPQALCLSCKEHDSYAALAEATADWERNPHASHWGDMECVLCHNQHRADVLYCTQCHPEVPLPERWEPAIPASSGS